MVKTEYLGLETLELEKDRNMSGRSYLEIMSGTGSNNSNKIDKNAKSVAESIKQLKESPATVFMNATEETEGIYTTVVSSITSQTADLIVNGIYVIKLNVSNKTAIPVIKINGRFTKELKKISFDINETGLLSAFEISDLAANSEYLFRYNGTCLVLIGSDAQTLNKKKVSDFVLKSEVVDTLVSSGANVPLSANQGKVLDAKIDTTKTDLTNLGKVVADNKTATDLTIATNKNDINKKVDDNKTATDTLITNNNTTINTKVDTIKTATDKAILDNNTAINTKVDNNKTATDNLIAKNKADIEKSLLDHTTASTAAMKLKADLVDGLIPSAQLPSYVDDVIEFDLKSKLPTTGEQGKIYVIYGDIKANNGQYRWTGTVYSLISNSLDYATSEEALAGVEDTKVMTALKVNQAVTSKVNTAVDTIKTQLDTVNTAIETKVSKVTGKSLIADTEIARLANVNNYDDTAVKKQITDSIASIASEVTNRTNADANTLATAKAYTDTKVADIGGGIALTHSRSGSRHLLTGVLPSSGIVTCTFKATASFVEGDSFSINGSVYSAKPNGEETALPGNSFVTGDIVSVNVDIAGKKLGFKLGGGGVNDTLPSQITNFRGEGKDGAVQLNWSNPPSDFSGLYITRKAGSMPTKITDGTKLNCGTATSYLDSGLSNGTTYYYRAFPYNSKKQLQTVLINATTNAKASAMPANIAHASWSQIAAAASTGNIPATWTIGSEKDITLTTGEVLTLQIYDKNHDDLVSGGKAALTFGMKNLMAELRKMNNSNTNAGGFTGSAMYTWLQGALYNSLPADLRAAIKSVNKKTSAGNQSSTINTNAMKIFFFSEVECFGTTTYSAAGEGAQYPIFTDDASRFKKQSNGTGYSTYWWERSPHLRATTHFCVLDTNGAPHGDNAVGSCGICFGFCI